MTKSGFPAGSIPERWINLATEEKAIVGNVLMSAIHDRGVATEADFDNGIRAVDDEASQFWARLHGGPGDGTEMRFPLEYAHALRYPEIETAALTQEIIDSAVLEGAGSLPIRNHVYERRRGTSAPGAGDTADFDYTGVWTR